MTANRSEMDGSIGKVWVDVDGDNYRCIVDFNNPRYGFTWMDSGDMIVSKLESKALTELFKAQLMGQFVPRKTKRIPREGRI